MFGIFKKESPAQKLEKKRAKLLEEAFNLSKIDRTKSDAKIAEAEKIADEIAKLKG